MQGGWRWRMCASGRCRRCRRRSSQGRCIARLRARRGQDQDQDQDEEMRDAEQDQDPDQDAASTRALRSSDTSNDTSPTETPHGGSTPTRAAPVPAAIHARNRSGTVGGGRAGEVACPATDASKVQAQRGAKNGISSSAIVNRIQLEIEQGKSTTEAIATLDEMRGNDRLPKFFVTYLQVKKGKRMADSDGTVEAASV
ncbi:hypothetical protein JB92DRAFT_3099899 [Gautieria morchelliformis]|nr:hypothetical protein JB92DRAFT_3099899 [Gautieria morchelliformis]